MLAMKILLYAWCHCACINFIAALGIVLPGRLVVSPFVWSICRWVSHRVHETEREATVLHCTHTSVVRARRTAE